MIAEATKRMELESLDERSSRHRSCLGLGLHEEQGVLPVRPQTAKRNPECAVRVGQPGAFGCPLQNGQLLSQGEVFDSELALRPEARSGGCE